MKRPTWQVLKEERIYHNPPWLSVRQQTVQLPNGHIIDDYVLTDIPDVAMIFAITPEQQVLFVEQYKHGLQRNIWDLPAGYVDLGEEPLTAAKRELEEETGYVSTNWTHLHSLSYDSNRNGSLYHFYLAQDATLEGQRHFDVTENIQLHTVPLTEVFSVFTAGKIESAGSALGIYAALQRLT